MVTDLRLWKNNYEDPTKILEIDKKYTNYTSVTIEGELLNKEKADESKKLYEFNISDTDILIVETPKDKKEFTFTSSAVELDLDDDSTVESHNAVGKSLE